jgi:hypothetical protein
MSASTHQLTQRSTAKPTVEVRTEPAASPVEHAQERPNWFRGNYLRSRPIRAAAQEVKHLHQLERAGESEWTPWIAITGLILFIAAIGLLMFGIVETAAHLLASASSGG